MGVGGSYLWAESPEDPGQRQGDNKHLPLSHAITHAAGLQKPKMGTPGGYKPNKQARRTLTSFLPLPEWHPRVPGRLVLGAAAGRWIRPP